MTHYDDCKVCRKRRYGKPCPYRSFKGSSCDVFTRAIWNLHESMKKHGIKTKIIGGERIAN